MHLQPVTQGVSDDRDVVAFLEFKLCPCGLASANGAKINMVVDTGASTIVLNPSDAARAGIKVEGLRYSVPVQTANGTSFAARVVLKNVSIGPVSINNVDALIAKRGALRESLLGMSFLSRLRSYEFSGDFLTLRS